MASSGRPAPPKPWERAGTQQNNGPSPFAPPSNTSSTATIVASTDVANISAKPWETKTVDSGITRTIPVTDGDSMGRPMPPRPWEQPSSGYGTMTSYNRPLYGTANMYGGNNSYGNPYGSALGGYGSTYGGGYGYGSNYGGLYNRYSGGMGGYAGGMGPMGGYGMGLGSPYGYGGPADPNDPNRGPPPGPPSFWQSMLHALHSVLSFFGRLSILVDENTQAFHFFITALLQLCDRAGLLYGELARFVLGILGFRIRGRARSKAGARALQAAGHKDTGGKATAGDGGWDSVWSEGANNRSSQKP